MGFTRSIEGPFWRFRIEAGKIGKRSPAGILEVFYEVTPDGLFVVCPLCRSIHEITVRVHHGGHIGCLACPGCRAHAIYSLKAWLDYMEEKRIPCWRFEDDRPRV